MRKICFLILSISLLFLICGCATFGDVLNIAAGVASIATFGPGVGLPSMDTALDVWNIAVATGTITKITVEQAMSPPLSHEESPSVQTNTEKKPAIEELENDTEKNVKENEEQASESSNQAIRELSPEERASLIAETIDFLRQD